MRDSDDQEPLDAENIDRPRGMRAADAADNRVWDQLRSQHTSRDVAYKPGLEQTPHDVQYSAGDSHLVGAADGDKVFDATEKSESADLSEQADLIAVARAKVAEAFDSQSDAGDKSAAHDLEAQARYTQSIRDYSEEEYKKINHALGRGSIQDVQVVAHVSHDLSAGLASRDEVSDTVYRGSLPGRSAESYNIERYEPGAIVVENWYTSSSRSPEEEFGGEILWVIESRYGKDISGDSTRPWEQEVLFDHFTRFGVLDKTYDVELKRWVVYMEEL
jgi:hypothetical protein